MSFLRMTMRASLAGLLAASTAANAHMPYLLPNVFDVGKRDYVTVEGSFTEEFFAPDAVMKSDDYHVVGPDGAKQALTPVYTRDLAIVEAATTAQGTYRVSTGQRTGRTAKAAWVGDDWKFLRKDEAPPAGSKAYDVVSMTMAEVYVSRGKPNDAALAPRNTGLEFQAITHPSSIFVGSDAKFVALLDGKPLANQVISVYGDAARYADKKMLAEVTTDAQGRFAVKPDKPGPYVAMTRHRPAPDRSPSGAMVRSPSAAVTGVMERPNAGAQERPPAAHGQSGVSYTYSLVFEATQ